MPNRYWGILIVFIAAQLSPALGFPILQILFPNLSPIDQFVYWIIFSMGVATLIVLFLLRPDIENINLRNEPSTGEVVKWSLLGIPIAYATQIFVNLINIELIGIEEGSENTAEIMGVIDENIWFIIYPILFAPILEEVVFRKVIFGELYKRMNFLLAAIISAFVFAALHWDFTFILTYTAMGIVFAYLYVRTKRIIVPIIAHMSINTIAVLIQLNVDIEELERQLQDLENSMTIFFGG
ncbi:CPBP family intramembrane glutamic endopeptidase [Alkalibacillus aidingensis]|uniref:CPBP family intramembrane glutamic endopeptidase n=1 Tax=Alkalibacillus aidingensis TaxID=2747607 RepID=UPI0016614971|nr:type II CAAX endopeptidase family protein [Alkalibacillus aidingensis]